MSSTIIDDKVFCAEGKEEEEIFVACNTKHEKFQENAALLALLKVCAKEKDLYKGSKLHAEILKRGLLKKDIHVGSTLISLYAKCGILTKAQEVFDELPIRDVVCWTALMTGYAQHGCGEKALNCFVRMQREGFSPDSITFVCALKACGSIGAIDKGIEIHMEIVRVGLLGKLLLLDTALVDMYAKCGALAKAQEVLDSLPVRNVVIWNALIAGYAQYGYNEEALNCLERMQQEDLCPDAVTYVCILKACGSMGAIGKGKIVYANIVKEGLLEKNVFVGNALMDMFTKCGALAKAQEVFNELFVRDVVSWNVLISGYIQHRQATSALDCFDRMQQEGLAPDAVTFVCVLNACGSIGAVDKGKEVHTKVVSDGGWLLQRDIFVGIALVDMYAKCGAVARAQEVFDNLPARHIAAWNALITGYAQLGKDDIVCNSFDKMIGEGIVPDLVTFTVVLNACSHSGMLEKGQRYFKMMNTCYGIIPTSEHYTCMVDLFGRAGHFHKAVEVIKEMPTSNCLPVWTALLGACRIRGNVKLGRWAFEHAIQLEKKHGAAYMCMSNTYVAAAMQEEAVKVDAMRVRNEAW